MECFIRKLGSMKTIDPDYGDLKLTVMPFKHNVGAQLPKAFSIWQQQVDEILNLIPNQLAAQNHYLTIDSKYFTEDDYLRREGLHIDGNFCYDPDFGYATWGGTTWAGTCLEDGKVKTKFKSPFNAEIPRGEYVSENKGGLITVSSFSGCVGYAGQISNDVQSEGKYNDKHIEHLEPILFKANEINFMSSNTPHKTLMIPQGTRRTLIRITLDCNYDNSVFKGDTYYKIGAKKMDSNYKEFTF